MFRSLNSAFAAIALMTSGSLAVAGDNFYPDPKLSDKENQFIEAIQDGELDTVREFFKDPDIDVNLKYFERTPIAEALHKVTPHLQMVNLFLQNPKVDINDGGINPPIVIASENGLIQVVQTLLSFDNLQVNNMGNGSTVALVEAADRGYQKIVELLLSHPDIDVNNLSYGDSALARACRSGHLDIARLLLARDDLNVNAGDDKSALSEASAFLQFEAMRLLLQHPDIDVNKGSTPPLAWAAFAKSIEAMEILLAHPQLHINAGWGTAINVVAQSNWVEGAEFLLSKKLIDVNAGAVKPVVSAAQYASAEVMALLLAHPTVKINATDFQGRHALVVAVTGEPFASNDDTAAYRTIEVLLKDPRLNAKMWGPSALGIARKYNLKKIEKLLLTHPDISDDDDSVIVIDN